MRIRPDHVGLTGEKKHSNDILGAGEFRQDKGRRHYRQYCHNRFAKTQIHGITHSNFFSDSETTVLIDMLKHPWTSDRARA
jgi:hypothetical protein